LFVRSLIVRSLVCLCTSSCACHLDINTENNDDDEEEDSTEKGSPYSIAERRVPELIPVLGCQPAGDVSHKPSGRLPLLSARPAVIPQSLRGLLPIFASW